MKKALEERLMRLIYTNNNDSCTKTTLITNKHYDLYKVVSDENLKQFISGETNKLLIQSADNLNTIEKNLKSAANFEEYLKILQDNCIELNEKKVANLTSDFEKYSKQYLPDIIRLCNNKKQQFLQLNRTAKSYDEDEGVWPLYFAYGFLTGKLNSGTGLPIPLRAPILLFSVQIVDENNQLFIKKLDESPVWNEKLEVAVKRAYNLIKENKQGLDFADDESTEFTLATIIQKIEDVIGYKLNPLAQTLIPFEKMTDAQLRDITDLQIQDCAVLGLFEPSGGALKVDLEQIIDESKNDKDEHDFFDENNKHITDKHIREEVLNNKANIFEINQRLNIYQKYALDSALCQNTLIYGPPGTGKSEVIANIIFNALINGKTSLLVSEKRAALDILTSRLGKKLSLFSLNLYDMKDKEAFYKKISQIGDVLTSSWMSDRKKGTFKGKTAIAPLNINQENLTPLADYAKWYEDLRNLINKHLNVEKYADGVFDFDYADYEKIKRELGDSLIQIWLNTQYDDEKGEKKSLLQLFDDQFSEFNFMVPSDLFISWDEFVKFLKKYKIVETTPNPKDIKPNLERWLNRINANKDLVQEYLISKVQNDEIIKRVQEFENEFAQDKLFVEFNKKTLKEKRNYLKDVDKFITFYNDVMVKNSQQNKSYEEIAEIANKVKDFFKEYADLITLLKDINLLDFAIDERERLQSFLKWYGNDAFNDVESQKVMLGEFVLNNTIVYSKEQIDNSYLTIKDTKVLANKADKIIKFFRDFLENEEILCIKGIQELSQYLPFFKENLHFFEELIKNREFYDSDKLIKMRDNIDLLSLPYLRDLYLHKSLFIFDYPAMERVDQLSKSCRIDGGQYQRLKIIELWNKILTIETRFNQLHGFSVDDDIKQLKLAEEKSARDIEEQAYNGLVETMRDNLSRLKDDEKHKLSDIFKIAGNSSNYPSVAKFVKTYYPILRYIFPIFVGRPENVATLVPFVKDEFDYGIFDEASQMFVERAYPCVYRTKIKIVSGDDKQLRPTSFFMSQVQSTEYDIDDLDKVDSLLERAKSAWWPSFNLRNHYRSDSKELVEFSNKYIYNDSLEVATKQGCFEKAIEVIDCDGIFDDGVNETEAHEVIRQLKNNYMNYDRILVVSFNAKQAAYIERLINDEYSKFDKRLRSMLDHGQIIITNLENVQGNEGDLVILSVAYGKYEDGRIATNFGPLLTAGGANRLNVAITRARKKMIIIKSILGTQITVTNSKNNNALIFKRFIEYADTQKKTRSLNDQLNMNLVDNSQANLTNDLSDVNDDVVKEIYSELIKINDIQSKYKIIPNLNISNKQIALTIYNKEQEEIDLLIIVEKWKELPMFQDLIEDVDRQLFLDDRGYQTCRIKHFEWFVDRNKIISKIKNLLEKAPEDRNPINVAVFAKEWLNRDRDKNNKGHSK